MFRDDGDVVERDIETSIDESPQFGTYFQRPVHQIFGRTILIEGPVPTDVLKLSGIGPVTN